MCLRTDAIIPRTRRAGRGQNAVEKLLRSALGKSLCGSPISHVLDNVNRSSLRSFLHFVLSGWTPLGRGSDGRFGLRRFRAKLTPTPFGTHRAFTHALPPSFGLRSVPFTVPPCFFPLPL